LKVSAPRPIAGAAHLHHALGAQHGGGDGGGERGGARIVHRRRILLGVRGLGFEVEGSGPRV